VRYHLYLPQLRLPFEALVERAQAAEAAGFEGIALMDHLAPPRAEHQPMYEAMTVATWLAARTTTLRIGHLVLCDAFRHPAVLARQAVSLDHASGGRFELGIGWGSVPAELVAFGVTDDGPAARFARLAETVEVVRALWSGQPVSYRGRFHRLEGVQQQPEPLGHIPLIIGGTGPRTLELASSSADWWNLPSYDHHRLAELVPRARPARASVLQIVGYVPDEEHREEVVGSTARRFGPMGDAVVGDAGELRARFAALEAAGVERAYVWFSDFAPPATLAAFGREVIGVAPAPGRA
jgi:alkanesulfonate monooxygenase SsuD/methylene tetrahydromethanopterin reductase-like flavin-dependent oxidoreductase (luciferase family)